MTGALDAPRLRDVQREAEARLAAAGVDTPQLDARLLVCHALGLTRERLLIQATAWLNAAQVERVMGLVERRVRREPVSRILGRREFWGLEFALTPATLDPRPDSETVVEAVLRHVADRSAPLSLADLGTGTGCLLLSLLSELPNARGTGIDIAPAAVEAARANAARLNLSQRARFVTGDFAAGWSGQDRFDVVVSNPPYVPSEAIAGLQPEVAVWEPRAALDGGADGLDAYRALARRLPELLAPYGLAALEIGAGQGDAVTGLLESAGLEVIGRTADLAGVERCITVRRGS